MLKSFIIIIEESAGTTGYAENIEKSNIYTENVFPHMIMQKSDFVKKMNIAKVTSGTEKHLCV